MDLREKIVAVLADNVADYPEANDFGATADAILSIPELKEALREVELRERIEARLAGTADERPFVDGQPNR